MSQTIHLLQPILVTLSSVIASVGHVIDVRLNDVQTICRVFDSIAPLDDPVSSPAQPLEKAGVKELAAASEETGTETEKDGEPGAAGEGETEKEKESAIELAGAEEEAVEQQRHVFETDDFTDFRRQAEQKTKK
jgi:hypothetical protein